MDCWNFSHGGLYEELGMVTSGATFMQTVTTGGTNAKGSWAQLGSSTLAHAAKGVIVHIKGVGNSFRHLVDIGVGTTGNEVVLLENVPWLFSNSATNVYRAYFPCDLPSGTQINVRAQTNQTGGGTLIVGCHFLKAPMFPWAAGSIVDDYGASLADTQGTSVAAGAVANTYGSWTEITASTTRAYKGLILTPGYTAAGTTPKFIIDVGVGSAGNENVILKEITGTRGADIGSPVGLTVLPCNLPAGSRVAMRVQSDVALASMRMMFFGCA